MKRRTPPNSINGRDGFIAPQAMLYAIGYIQSLPSERQEWSNMFDMCRIVRAQQSPFTISHMINLEQFHGFKIDLWPEGDEELTASERAKRDAFNRQHEEQRKQRIEFAIQLAQPFTFMPSPSFNGYGQREAA